MLDTISEDQRLIPVSLEIESKTLNPLVTMADKLRTIVADPSLSEIDKQALQETASQVDLYLEDLRDKRKFLDAAGVTDPTVFVDFCLDSRNDQTAKLLIAAGIPLAKAHFGPDLQKPGEIYFSQRTENASSEAITKALVGLEFLEPGETLTKRITRIKGNPEYYKLDDGSDSNIPRHERRDPATGEFVDIAQPNSKRIGVGKGTIELASPLLGTGITCRIFTPIEKTPDGNYKAGEPNSDSLIFITGTGTKRSWGETLRRCSV